jgi:hypothetical protein
VSAARPDPEDAAARCPTCLLHPKTDDAKNARRSG